MLTRFSRSFSQCLAALMLALCGCTLVNNTARAQGVAVPAPTGAASDAVPVLSEDYRLNPADQVDVTVEGHEEFNKSFGIPPDGKVTYFGHTVPAAGMTVDKLTAALTKALHGQLLHPELSVTIRQTHPRQVAVIGTARAPGMVDYRPGMKLLDAIASSGGPTQAPEMTDATLVTNNGTTNQPIDLVKLMAGADPALNVPLQPGDILSLQARNPATSMVLIRGQVAHEGQYPVRPEGATLLAMLTQAGGALPSAAITRVQLTHDGQTRVLDLRPTLFDTTAPVGQTPVAAGDTVAVPLNNAKYMVLGEVNSRNVFGLPDGEPVTVTKALALAGGPTPDADMKNVQIVRADAQGKLTYLPVNVDDILRKRSGADPTLRDADILYFPKRSHSNTSGSIQNGLGTIFSLGALSNLLRGL